MFGNVNACSRYRQASWYSVLGLCLWETFKTSNVIQEVRCEIFKGQPVYLAMASKTPKGIQVSKLFLTIIGIVEVDIWHLLNDADKEKVIEYLKTQLK